MTEPLPSTETEAAKPRRCRRYCWWGAGVLVLVLIVVAFLASRAGLDKALVKQQLDNFIVHAKQQARDRGRDLDITYGDLAVAGSFANKHVEVKDVTVKIKPLRDAAMANAPQRANSSLQVTTPLVNVFPTAANLSSFRIELPQPIDFASQEAPEKSLMKITSNTAPSIAIGSVTESDVLYRTTQYRLADEMEFTYLREQQAQGAEDQAPQLTPVYEVLKVSAAGGGEIETKFADANDLGEAKVDFGNVTITPQNAPEGAVTILGLHGHWSNALNEAKQNVQLAKLDFGPLQAPEGLIPFAPISLNMEASYTGAMPQNAAAVASIASQESKISLKNFSFVAKDSGIKATADFSANAGDVLPVGTAKVALTNVPFLLSTLKEYQLIAPVQEQMIGTLLAQVTGTPIADIKNTEIAISRARGGAFKIGNSTFEELFATVLKMAMQSKSGAGAIVPPQASPGSAVPLPVNPNPEPVTPNAAAPAKVKSAPIELHDQSTRG